MGIGSLWSGKTNVAKAGQVGYKKRAARFTLGGSRYRSRPPFRFGAPIVTKKSTSDRQETPPPSFEDSLERLEAIVQQLEQGKLGLSESLGCYEEGVTHLKLCYRALESAERKIELLSGFDADGNPVTEAFEEGELTLDEKAASRSRRRSRPRNSEDNSEEDRSTTLF